MPITIIFLIFVSSLSSFIHLIVKMPTGMEEEATIRNSNMAVAVLDS